MFSLSLVTEHFIAGISAWIWLFFYFNRFINYAYAIMPDKLFNLVNSATVYKITVLIVLTYIIGVFTATLSYIVEKIVIGRTSKPKPFFKKLGCPDEKNWQNMWYATWKYDNAYKLITENEGRVKIARGFLFSSLIAFLFQLTAFSFHIFGFRINYLKTPYNVGPLFNLPYLFLVILLVIVFIFTWISAILEYHSRVRVASELIEKFEADVKPKKPNK